MEDSSAAVAVAEGVLPTEWRSSRLNTALYACTAFLGAGLLFVVEPLVAKLLIPSFGGSATVWSTSTLVFQVLLLISYGYVHWATTRLGRSWQPKAHFFFLLLPLVALPLAIPADPSPPSGSSPVLWLIRTILLVVGLPFAVVATTGPLLQRWYSWGSNRRSDDPYFLFAASNLGSFVGLLAYPLLIEPHLSLAAQRSWWSMAFVVFLTLTASCGLAVRGKAQGQGDATMGPKGAAGFRALGLGKVAAWTGLAFLPSSLMLGVTAHNLDRRGSPTPVVGYSVGHLPSYIRCGLRSRVTSNTDQSDEGSSRG